jgi:hypothetical protein
MIIRAEPIIIIKLDREDADDFLLDPTEVQKRVSEKLKAFEELKTTARTAPAVNVPPVVAAAMKRRAALAPKKAVGKKRTVRKEACSECGKELPLHWMGRHMQKEHGIVAFDARAVEE